MRTNNLDVVQRTREEALAAVEALPPDEKAQVSADWLARVRASPPSDPWLHGFDLVHRETGATVGGCGFKGPPAEGTVEIAYGVEPDHRGKGYATEAAAALTAYAFESGRVKVVVAHTLPGPNASTRVLTKCGFRCVGEVTDPEDGRVWRWETTKLTGPAGAGHSEPRKALMPRRLLQRLTCYLTGVVEATARRPDQPRAADGARPREPDRGPAAGAPRPRMPYRGRLTPSRTPDS